MFPYAPPVWRRTAAERNAERDAIIRQAARDARLAAERIARELQALEDVMVTDDWAAQHATEHGHHHLAQRVGSTFADLSHPLRYVHDAAVLAATHAGAYEAPDPEPVEPITPDEHDAWSDAVEAGHTDLGVIEYTRNERAAERARNEQEA